VTEDWYFASHRLSLARAAVAAGYRVVVATRIGRHADAIRATGSEVVSLPWRRRVRWPWIEVANILQLAALYRRLHPTIVPHVALKPIVYGSIAAWLAGVRCVVNAFSGLGYVFSASTLKARALRPALRQLLRLAVRLSGGAVTVQNPDDALTLERDGI